MQILQKLGHRLIMSRFRKFERSTVSYTTHSSFLRQIRSGNDAAWNEFYRKYAGMIHAIGKQRKLTREECDDLMVDVMVIFWKKVDSFFYDPSRGKFRSYLAKITNYAAMKIFSRRPPDPGKLTATAMELKYPEGIDEIYMAQWQDFIIGKAMQDLQSQVDTESYQVFYMLFIQHRKISEISEITRKSRNNIYVIRSRCMKKLEKLITFYRQCEESELISNSHSNEDEN